MSQTDTIEFPALAALDDKVRALEERFHSMQRVIVAFSAGVDSTYLAAVAARVLGPGALAITASSASFPQRELAEARQLAQAIGIAHRVVESDEPANPDYANNPENRCYHCKTELFAILRRIAAAEGFAHIVDGTNADDLGDHRPGRRAAEEKAVESPLQELGFTKADIREASRRMGLATADKPAFSCLASRFPYGEKITVEGLKKVEGMENTLRDLGFAIFRVRMHREVVRIELDPGDIPRAAAEPARSAIVASVKAAGFRYVTLDLQGYRRGSLNQGLAP